MEATENVAQQAKKTRKKKPVGDGPPVVTAGTELAKALAPSDIVMPPFDIDPHLITFLMEEPFFTEISRNIVMIPTMTIPTAAVCYNLATDQITMLYNPAFFASLSTWEIRGVFRHEFYHIVFGHLTSRRREPGRDWNIATDLAINSIIMDTARSSGNANDDGRPLPRFALIPGQWPTKPDGTPLSDDEKRGAELGALIAQFPKMMASEWYFEKIQEAKRESIKKSIKKAMAQSGGGGKPGEGEGEGESEQGEGEAGGEWGDGEGWIDSMDSHTIWDDLSEAEREFVQSKVRAMVEKAVQHADQLSSGWGNIPQELREQIRKSVSTIIDWKAVLRQFIGHMIRGARTSSIKRINRRYPMVHPGTKRNWVAKLLVARDESGSVDDEALALFFGELMTFTKRVEIDFVPFDCNCSVKDVVRWQRNNIPHKATLRTKCGGTNFDAPTRVFNDPKNRGRWDGLLILTDGCAPAPVAARGKRGWVLAPGCKLEFPSNELQVFVTKDKPMIGAWR